MRDSSATNRPHGTGPGVITEDGCSVEVYAQLPVGDEAEIIGSVLRPGVSILEVCAGTGRIADALTERGFRVVATDYSAEMLARVRVAETVCSPIESLSLGERFDAVVFASHMINRVDVAWCAAVLDACRRHVADDGCILIERRHLGWFDNPTEFTRDLGSLTLALTDVSKQPGGEVAGTFTYRNADGAVWTHRVTSRRVDDLAMTAELDAAGLVFDRLLDEHGKWVKAKPGQAVER